MQLVFTVKSLFGSSIIIKRVLKSNSSQIQIQRAHAWKEVALTVDLVSVLGLNMSLRSPSAWEKPQTCQN